MESEDIKNGEFYKYGDILRIINMETKEIQNFGKRKISLKYNLKV